MPMRAPSTAPTASRNNRLASASVKKPVRDGAAERRLAAGAIGVDVNPLAVAGDVGELGNLVLRHLSPRRHHLLADEGHQTMDINAATRCT